MKLLLDAGTHPGGSCIVRDGRLTPGVIDAQADWNTLVPDGTGGSIDLVGYFLKHGGDEVTEPVVSLDGTGAELLSNGEGLPPEDCALTKELIAFWKRHAPNARHVLLSDTAFFNDLPPDVAYYAVPWELWADGVRRSGADGLLQQWVWNQLERSSNRYHQVVSVHLADQSNVVAIEDGRPIDTTSGFAPVEGLPSATSCGDIDPTLIFEFQAAGSNVAEIRRTLSAESGFGALLGRPCGYRELISCERDRQMALVRRIFRYSLQKAIGSLTASMGGADAIVFAGTPLHTTTELASEVCMELASAGVETGRPAALGGMTRISGPGSAVDVFCVSPNRWRILSDTVEAWLAREVRKVDGHRFLVEVGM